MIKFCSLWFRRKFTNTALTMFFFSLASFSGLHKLATCNTKIEQNFMLQATNMQWPRNKAIFHHEHVGYRYQYASAMLLCSTCSALSESLSMTIKSSLLSGQQKISGERSLASKFPPTLQRIMLVQKSMRLSMGLYQDSTPLLHTAETINTGIYCPLLTGKRTTNFKSANIFFPAIFLAIWYIYMPSRFTG